MRPFYEIGVSLAACITLLISVSLAVTIRGYPRQLRNSLMLASGLRTFVDGRNRNIKTIGPVMGHYRNRIRLAMRHLKPLL